MLLQTTVTDTTIQIIQQLGFPIFVGLLLFGFAWKAWQYMTRKMDEKDKLITEQINKSNEHREKLIESQNRIVDTQREIKLISQSHLDLTKEIKDLIRDRG